MAHTFSLAFLTVGNISPLEAVKIAASLGYQSVGLRLLPASTSEPAYPLLSDKALLNDTLKALKDYNIAVGDVEIVRLQEETEVERFKPFIEIAHKLGAKHVLVAGDDFDRNRLIDNFGQFCRLAATANLTADLEFMPWTAVKSVGKAKEVVEKAAEKNGGILIDALHFDRSRSTLDDIANLPASMIHYIQLCDGPSVYGNSDKELIAVARTGRLMPGWGGIDLVSLVNVVPENIPISLEIANLDIQKKFGAQACARMAIEAAQKILDKAGKSPLKPDI